MAKTRLPTLDITPELPQVVSQDLNWFYKPEAVPVSDTYGDLAKTLDNFAKGALTKMAVADEIELQQEGEAKAKADTAKIEYDEGIKTFAEYAKKNNISNNANPYYVTEMKNLYLQNKAGQFQTYLNTEYAKNNIADRALNEPNVFNDFYGETLKKFVIENNLNAFDPVVMNENFFKKTDGYRNSLSATHNQSILTNADVMFQNNMTEHFTTVIKEHYGKKNGFDAIATAYTNEIKRLFDITGSSKVPIEYIEKGIEALIDSDGISNDKKMEIITQVMPKVLLGTGNYADTERGKAFINEQRLKLVDKNNKQVNVDLTSMSHEETIENNKLFAELQKIDGVPAKIAYLNKYITGQEKGAKYGLKLASQLKTVFEGTMKSNYQDQLLTINGSETGNRLEKLDEHYAKNGNSYDYDTLNLYNKLKQNIIDPDKNFLFTTQETGYKSLSETFKNFKAKAQSFNFKGENEERNQLEMLSIQFESDVYKWTMQNPQGTKTRKDYIKEFNEFLGKLVDNYSKSPDFNLIRDNIKTGQLKNLISDKTSLDRPIVEEKKEEEDSWDFNSNTELIPRFSENTNQAMENGYIPYGLGYGDFVSEAKKTLSKTDSNFDFTTESSYKLIFQIFGKEVVLRWVKPNEFERYKNDTRNFQVAHPDLIKNLQALDFELFNDNRFK